MRALYKTTTPENWLPLTTAGQFFAADGQALRRQIKEGLAAAQQAYPMPWKAIVAPHAGYRYSGSVAASVYRSLGAIAGKIDKVILLSPAHKKSFEGIATLNADGFDTPLGSVAIFNGGVLRSLSSPGVKLLPEAFNLEHGIETHIPFIKQFLPHAAIVPFVVGRANVDDLSKLIDLFITDPGTLVVVSTDLSHFLNLKEATARDRQTCKKIELFQSSTLTNADACGFLPLAALLKVAERRDWRVTHLDSKTSADASGNSERVVGYCGYGLEPSEEARLPERSRQELLSLANKVLKFAATKKKQPEIRCKRIDFPLLTHRRTFVTYSNGGRLRGCKGSGTVRLPLIYDVARNAAQSALADRRFNPIGEDEVGNIGIEISVLSNDQPLPCENEGELVDALRPGIDGLTIEGAGRRAMFLPKVWDKVADPQTFVRRLKEKAGLGVNDWPSDMKCWRHRAETFGA